MATELASGGFAISWRAFNTVTKAVAAPVRVYSMNGAAVGAEVLLQPIANPGLGIIYDLELMANGKVMAIGNTVGNGAVATQVFDFGDERLLGSAAADKLYGKDGVNDVIKGRAGNDQLFGRGGNDELDGETGADRMTGGKGNDLYIVDNVADVAIEAASQGTDRVAASVTTTLAVNIENLTLTGGNAINGTGNTLGNVIVGNSAANVLAGREGHDTLTGGAGADAFLFNTALNAATNVDAITDFSVADDTIRLDDAIFTLLTQASGAVQANGLLDPGAFAANATGTATAAGHRIVYNTATGELFYDTNGNGLGGAIKFAVLTDPVKPILTEADILIV
jgi:Ca2+-binding RTX toxin-like protein